MEAKLKALKVTDLKELLTKSGTPIPSKANKADLIAKILATPNALKLVEGGGEAPKGDDDELLAPPDEFDWDGGADASKPAPAEAVATSTAHDTHAAETLEETATAAEDAPAEGAANEPPVPAAAETTGEPASVEPSAKTPEELELERRKARAARFGIPLVEESPADEKGPRAPRAKGRANPGTATGASSGAQGGAQGGGGSGRTSAGRGGNKGKSSVPIKDAGKTTGDGGGNNSAEGQSKPVKISSKEAAPNDDDAKLAARAARFNIAGPSEPVDPTEDEKRKKREARFGGAESTSKKAKTDA